MHERVNSLGDPELAALALALSALHRPVMARVFPYIAGAIHGREMTFSQVVAVYLVFMDGPRRISDIAASADLTHNAASRLVDRLVQAGFLTRTENPEDRREKRVELTETGAAFPSELTALSVEIYKEHLASLPGDLVGRLAGVMAELQAHLALAAPSRDGSEGRSGLPR